MTRRRVAAAELGAHLEWLRTAVHDGHLDSRLVLEGVIDALVLLADIQPGAGRPAPAEPEAGPVLQ